MVLRLTYGFLYGLSGQILGYLTLRGSFDSLNYSGQFYYANEVFSNPEYNTFGCDGKGACGQMGGFSIQTCQIFNCNAQ